VQQMNDYGEKLKKDSGSYKHYDQDGYSIWAYTRPFKSVQQLNSQLTDLPQASPSVPSTPGTPPTPLPQPSTSDTFTVTQEGGFPTSTFHVTGKMSLVIPASADADVDQTTRDLLKDARETFVVTMPGWVTSHQGGNVNGNIVTYTVPLNEQATIDVVGGGINPLVYLIGGGVLVLLLVVAAVIVFLLARRRGAVAVPAAVPTASYPYPGMTE
jgi:hypothetical protein